MTGSPGSVPSSRSDPSYRCLLVLPHHPLHCPSSVSCFRVTCRPSPGRRTELQGRPLHLDEKMGWRPVVISWRRWWQRRTLGTGQWDVGPGPWTRSGPCGWPSAKLHRLWPAGEVVEAVATPGMAEARPRAASWSCGSPFGLWAAVASAPGFLYEATSPAEESLTGPYLDRTGIGKTTELIGEWAVGRRSRWRWRRMYVELLFNSAGKDNNGFTYEIFIGT